MADAQKNILAAQLKLYKLCKYCLDRHGGGRQKPDGPCYICRGLMLEKDLIVKEIASAARGYQFDTFLIGAVLPTQIYEREDAMRARLKIRGRESVKSQLTRELGLSFARATRKRVDYLNPDLMINLTIDKEGNIELSTRSRPMSFQGTYKKNARGLPQKQERCDQCEGKGCGKCGSSGLSGYDSVEGIIAKEIMRRTGGRTPKFSWFGSEDRNSLVLGKGRPFYARIADPRKRKFHSSVTIRSDAVAARLVPSEDMPVPQAGFRVRTRIVVRCDKMLENEDLQKTRSLAGAEVRFETKPSRLAAKKIYSAVPRRIDERTFSLTIVADGGLMIKQFVGGQEYMKPNLSEIVGHKCDCVAFDIMGVQA